MEFYLKFRILTNPGFRQIFYWELNEEIILCNISVLMREPVLQDNRKHHNKFCLYANELLESVSGKPNAPHVDASLERIRLAHIVSQTKILYPEKELLQLIHSYLVLKGLEGSAGALQKEADLPRASTPPTVPHPSSPHLFATPTSSPRLVTAIAHISSSKASSWSFLTSSSLQIRTLSSSAASSRPRVSSSSSTSHSQPTASPVVPSTSSHRPSTPLTSSSRGPFSPPGTPLGPIRVNVNSSRNVCTTSQARVRKRRT